MIDKGHPEVTLAMSDSPVLRIVPALSLSRICSWTTFERLPLQLALVSRAKCPSLLISLLVT